MCTIRLLENKQREWKFCLQTKPDIAIILLNCIILYITCSSCVQIDLMTNLWIDVLVHVVSWILCNVADALLICGLLKVSNNLRTWTPEESFLRGILPCTQQHRGPKCFLWHRDERRNNYCFFISVLMKIYSEAGREPLGIAMVQSRGNLHV